MMGGERRNVSIFEGERLEASCTYHFVQKGVKKPETSYGYLASC